MATHRLPTMPSPLMIFGDTVRKLRLARGLSQEDLAELCELHRTYVGGIERGERNIGLLNVLAIAKALDVLPSRLLQGFTEKVMAGMSEKNN